MNKENIILFKKSIINEFSVLRTLAQNPNLWIILLVDLTLISFSLYVSYVIRFESIFPEGVVKQFYTLLPVLLIVKVIFFYIFGLYRGMWRYTSIRDLMNIFKASLSAAVISVVLLLYFNRFYGLSRSVFILDTLFTFLFIAGHRVIIRFYYNRFFVVNGKSSKFINDKVIKRLLLVGAGDSAEKVIRELNNNSDLPYLVVGLVADDHKKVGMKIHGIPVIGLVEDIEKSIYRANAQEILIAVSAISRSRMKKIVEQCQSAGLPFKVIPSMGEIIGNKVSINLIREIDYMDLLGREEINLEQDRIGRYLASKVVLVTGAGGSIGSELCKQILKFSPGKIILFDASEENLYRIQMDLVHKYKIKNVVAILGYIQDRDLLDLVFRTYSPSVVFHAAAYKHVPLVEKNPWQAVTNNIIATQELLQASIAYKVDHVVLVSTDKAVKPTNVMGASKRLTELLITAYSRQNWDGTLGKKWATINSNKKGKNDVENLQVHNTRMMAVRFGNVIGSSGSVIPLFKKQIEQGGPVTVTHPEITRYFMSIDEAAQLILQTGAMGQDGEIFILRMGEPLKIDQMARDLIQLAGKEPEVDIKIEYSGLRSGEKLYEELITIGEGITNTNHEKIMVLSGECNINSKELHNHVEKLRVEANDHKGLKIKLLLKEIIPEYSPDLGGFVGYQEQATEEIKN